MGDRRIKAEERLRQIEQEDLEVELSHWVLRSRSRSPVDYWHSLNEMTDAVKTSERNHDIGIPYQADLKDAPKDAHTKREIQSEGPLGAGLLSYDQFESTIIYGRARSSQAITETHDSQESTLVPSDSASNGPFRQ